MDVDMSVRNGTSLQDVLEALDNDDAREGRRLLRRWMADEPLPCPCCGGKGEFLEHQDNGEIYCAECGMRTSVMDYADAVATWNRRPHVGETDR